MSPGYEPRLETQLSLQNFELNLGYDLRLAVARTEYQDETLFIVCFTLPIKLRLKFGFFVQIILLYPFSTIIKEYIFSNVGIVTFNYFMLKH